MTTPLFANRQEAGQRLAERLLRFKDLQPIVLALPRGGVPIGYEVAKKLNVPLDLILVRKIGVPFQPELAYGAVVDGDHPEIVINEGVEQYLHLSKEILNEQSARALKEIKRRRNLYLAERPRTEAKDKTVLVVDDGIATGMTVRASLRAIRRAQPSKLVLAVPVAPSDTIAELRDDADEIICLATPDPFYAISPYYADFHQVSDDEVIALLEQANKREKVQKAPLAS
jgi:putative phosphoribosyl transferase